MELFLSHATADRTLTDLIIERLRAVGVSVYATEHDGKAGHNVHSKIQAAIRRADLVVVLLTERGDGSRYVHEEIGYAKRDGKLIIPLVSAAVARNGLGMLEGTEYIVVDDEDPAEALHRLSKRIDDIAEQRARKNGDLLVASLVLVTIGIVLLAMSEGTA
jgi:hypothetical protein